MGTQFLKKKSASKLDLPPHPLDCVEQPVVRALVERRCGGIVQLEQEGLSVPIITRRAAGRRGALPSDADAPSTTKHVVVSEGV